MDLQVVDQFNTLATSDFRSLTTSPMRKPSAEAVVAADPKARLKRRCTVVGSVGDFVVSLPRRGLLAALDGVDSVCCGHTLRERLGTF